MNAEKPVVIVTGSSGLIGGAFIERAAESYHIAGFDRDGSPQPSSACAMPSARGSRPSFTSRRIAISPAAQPAQKYRQRYGHKDKQAGIPSSPKP